MDERDRGPSQLQDPQATASQLSEVSLYLAKKYLASGEIRKARTMLEELVRRTPDAESLLLLAQLELDNPKRHVDALEHMRQAVAMSPQYTEAWLTLANYWSVRGQPEKQRRCLEKVLAYEPSNRDVRDALTLLLTKK